MTEPVTIGIGSNKWVKNANTKMITLYKPSNSGSVESLHDSSATDYQVPVGKKFIILKIYFGNGYLSSGNSSGTYSIQFQDQLYFNNVTDSIAGATKIYSNNGGFARTYDSVGWFYWNKTNDDVYIEVAAGNYIIADPTMSNSCNIIGIETDV